MDSKLDTLNRALWGFIGLGVALVLFNALNNRSLWGDEVSLALNISQRSASELFSPLDLNQVAPIGFLLLEKWFGSLGGYSDWSLRIVSLLSFLISIPLLYAVAKKVLNVTPFVLFAVALYVTSFHIVSYSWEVKQYMTDVLFCLVILYLTMRGQSDERKRFYCVFALLGTASIWLSNVAVICLFTGGNYLLYRAFRQGRNLALVMSMISCWLASFAVYYAFFVSGHPSRSYMLTFWANSRAFLPNDLLSVDFYSALIRHAKVFLGLLGDKRVAMVAVPFVVAGLLAFWKKDKYLLYLLLCPLALHVLLSYLKLYPFANRLILYLHPLLVLLVAMGAQYIVTLMAGKLRIEYLLVPLLAVNLLQLYALGFPVEKEEVKKTMTYLENNLAPEDGLYLYYSTEKAFTYYRAGYPQISKMANERITVGGSYRNNRPGYLRDIPLPVRPVWLLFSHIYRPWNSPYPIDEKEYILAGFRAKRFVIVDSCIVKGASLYRVVPNDEFVPE